MRLIVILQLLLTQVPLPLKQALREGVVLSLDSLRFLLAVREVQRFQVVLGRNARDVVGTVAGDAGPFARGNFC